MTKTVKIKWCRHLNSVVFGYIISANRPLNEVGNNGLRGDNAALWAVLSFLEHGKFHSLRTIAYIDGFNLYFGCLKQVPHCRWLDVESFVRTLCKEQDPQTNLLNIKYFTAPIKTGLSPRGHESSKAQHAYIRALVAHCPIIQIIEGKYFIVSGSYYGDTKPVDFRKKYKVLRPEEKQTDVNIALHMLSDATDGICDQQVLFSNDSDCAPILSTIRQRHPNMRFGVVPPFLKTKTDRHPSRELIDLSDWSRKPISESILLDCQLPERIPTRKKPILKPVHWQ